MIVPVKALPGRLRAATAAARLWWAPARIGDEGETPDYRFSLANERTFLAWLRTALALVGGGFAVAQFLPDLHRTLRVTLALLLLAVGAMCAVRAVHHWVRCELAMRRGEDLPVSRFPSLLALTVGAMAVVMVVAVAAGWAD
ncbi:YidH family protein [Streptomyces sp. 8N616]|uniref:YidH family protein n=1 Tax=Streptomyces sp. 8N616 TaxID=3457414 RepID=UPI003FD69C3E